MHFLCHHGLRHRRLWFGCRLGHGRSHHVVRLHRHQIVEGQGFGQVGFATRELGLQDVLQRPAQGWIGLLEETGSKLVQQAPDFFGRQVEHTCMLRQGLAVQLHMLQRMLQRTGNVGQGHEPDRAGAPGQRMRQADRGVAQRLVEFEFPLAELGQQMARPFVGLIEVHVVQRDADTKVADHLDLVVVGGFFFGHHLCGHHSVGHYHLGHGCFCPHRLGRGHFRRGSPDSRTDRRQVAEIKVAKIQRHRRWWCGGCNLTKIDGLCGVETRARWHSRRLRHVEHLRRLEIGTHRLRGELVRIKHLG